MEYLVTWSDGNDVNYRIVPADELPALLEDDRPYIVVPLVN
ncbi:MAG: hypothetical protein ACYDDN_04975 [Candidatus Desulforudaceae bacterium]|jgi:hypothetical protein|nr:hypothetical protein [Bacillota bacterium]MDP3050820.1 hypothetical protein [Eubacteriales bacterium]MDQ7790099.1 hypothetical protein [Clostridia bacterium]MDZ7610632.1 hypothetical protein [Eubacteriales bacterium]